MGWEKFLALLWAPLNFGDLYLPLEGWYDRVLRSCGISVSTFSREEFGTPNGTPRYETSGLKPDRLRAPCRLSFQRARYTSIRISKPLTILFHLNLSGEEEEAT